jgi:hypothetical protein
VWLPPLELVLTLTLSCFPSFLYLLGLQYNTIHQPPGTIRLDINPQPNIPTPEINKRRPHLGCGSNLEPRRLESESRRDIGNHEHTKLRF